MACAGIAFVLVIAIGEVIGKSVFGARPEGALPDTRAALPLAVGAWLVAQLSLLLLFATVTLTPPVQMITAVSANVGVALLVFRAATSGTQRPRVSDASQVALGWLGGLATFGVVWGVTIAVVALYVSVGIPQNEIPQQSAVEVLRSASVVGRTVIVVSACILAPFAEEVVFRGVLLPVLARMMHARIALLVQALIFGFVHFYTDPLSWPLSLPIAAVGWCAGWVYLRTGSLRAAIVLHMTFNALQIAILFATAG